MTRIGFMGLGIMGSAMARNLLRAGFPLMVYNRTAAKTADLAAAGAQVAASPLALAHDTEVLIAMVTGPEALEALLWGEEGAAAALGPGKTFINMSSVSPAYTLELAEQLQPLGVEFIEAPVSGTKKPAAEGTLIILAGGEQQKIEALNPIWQALGKKVVYCGPVGQGSMMKMTINLLLGVMMAGLAEAVNFGCQGGLNLETILEVILSGPLGCGLFQMKADLLRQQDFPVSFPLKHMTKDLKFIQDTAYATGAATLLAAAGLHLFRLGVNCGAGEEDFAAVAKVYQLLRGAA